MRTKIAFIERKFWEFVSIEKVFRQIAKELSPKQYEFEFVKLKYGNNLKGVIKNLLFQRRPNADILHITGHIHYIAMLFPAKQTVLTIHDLGFLRTNTGLKRYVLKKLFLDIPVRKLKYITTISEATRDEIVFNTNCDINKIRVIENPLSSEFNVSEKNEFDSKCPTILQIGTSANKNVPSLIKALKGINCKLEIIGRLSDEYLNLLKENHIKCENSFGLNDEEIILKYKNADIVSFCSTFEGFGLPIIESQAMKTPVVTSNISPMKEVAGIGAAVVDPDDIEQIRACIEKIIEDKDYREKLVSEGLENIKRFDARRITEKYQELYKEILSNN